MPRFRKPKFKATDVVVCIETYGHAGGVVKRNARRRGDDPAVRLHPHRWALDGSTDSEIHAQQQKIPPPPPHVPEFSRPVPPIPDDEAAVATVDFQIGLLGATKVFKGQRFRRDAKIVKDNPDYFRTPPQPIA